MMDYITDILLMLILAGLCSIGAYLLRTRKAQILATLTEIIQKVEEAVQGSGMGAQKKALVLAQLEAMGIKVEAWMSQAIDCIVKYLNDRQAWLTDQVNKPVE